MFEYKNFLFVALFCTFGLAQANNLPNFTELAEESSPAVVNITSTKTVTNRNSFGGGFGDPRYDEFFERFFGQPRRQDPRENSRPVVSTGSGFIISEDGYLLTLSLIHI